MNKIAFKVTNKELSSTTTIGGYITYRDEQLIKINTEYLNPYRCEGYANVMIQIDTTKYIRCFESKVSDFHLMNFITKFVNDIDYRKKYLVTN